MTQEKAKVLAPSLLARKILCPAYLPSSMNNTDRLCFQGFHSRALMKVIKRHLRLGFILKGVEERNENGFRNDLTFESPEGRIRIIEVKSAKQLTELHRLQAALYWTHSSDEVILSNGQEDIALPQDYIDAVHRRARVVCQLLTEHPQIAASSFCPRQDLCRICANGRCPFLPSARRTLPERADSC
jgi:hypothetical protein